MVQAWDSVQVPPQGGDMHRTIWYVSLSSSTGTKPPPTWRMVTSGWAQVCVPQREWNQKVDWDSWNTILLPHHQPIKRESHTLPINLPETQLRSLGILSMSYWFSSPGPCSRPFSAPYSSVPACLSLCLEHVNLGLATPSHPFKGNWLLRRKWSLGACPSYPSSWSQDLPSGASSLQREASQERLESRALAQISLSLPRSAFSEQSLSWLTPLYKPFSPQLLSLFWPPPYWTENVFLSKLLVFVVREGSADGKNRENRRRRMQRDGWIWDNTRGLSSRSLSPGGIIRVNVEVEAIPWRTFCMW